MSAKPFSTLGNGIFALILGATFLQPLDAQAFGQKKRVQAGDRISHYFVSGTMQVIEIDGEEIAADDPEKPAVMFLKDELIEVELLGSTRLSVKPDEEETVSIKLPFPFGSFVGRRSTEDKTLILVTDKAVDIPLSPRPGEHQVNTIGSQYANTMDDDDDDVDEAYDDDLDRLGLVEGEVRIQGKATKMRGNRRFLRRDR